MVMNGSYNNGSSCIQKPKLSDSTFQTAEATCSSSNQTVNASAKTVTQVKATRADSQV